MADPVSWMTMASMAASGAGSIIGGISGAKASGAQADMYAYQAGIAQLRKKMALQNRDFALEQGEEKGIRYGFKARNEAGKIITAQSASGIDLGSGSSRAVRDSQRLITEMDQKTIAENAARKAYGYETQATLDDEQSRMLTEASSRTRKAIPMQIATSLLSGVSSVSSKWLQANQSGMFSGSKSTPLGDTDPTYSNYGFEYT